MINEFKKVKPEEFGHLHLVYHFTAPLKVLSSIFFYFYFSNQSKIMKNAFLISY